MLALVLRQLRPAVRFVQIGAVILVGHAGVVLVLVLGQLGPFERLVLPRLGILIGQVFPVPVIAVLHARQGFVIVLRALPLAHIRRLLLAVQAAGEGPFVLPVLHRVPVPAVINVIQVHGHIHVAAQLVAFVLVFPEGVLLQFGNAVVQLLQIVLVGLEARRVPPAAAVASGQRRRVAYGVLHGPLAVSHVLVFVLLEQRVLVHIVLKFGPVHDLVVQAGDLVRVLALKRPRPAAHHALQIAFRLRHRRAGLVALAVLLQGRLRGLGKPGQPAAVAAACLGGPIQAGGLAAARAA